MFEQIQKAYELNINCVDHHPAYIYDMSVFMN